eukprot:TRINITY_DN13873_c0_g1_i1.p1 TRINITY_DN13873_c0_g1~~TRINITY_DN13873_c0_g1_i1.p1  ORF type:complete len:465 (+),score=97.68 TRINITY_DN13873_c0_g1_i1:71-1396(+)
MQRIRDSAHLNAFVAVADSDALRSAARAADARFAAGTARPLEGIPIAVKDNICVAGFAATCSSQMLATFQPTYDATAVRKLREAGAVVVGKTNMDEFGMGSFGTLSMHGPVKNPKDPRLVAGGSSSGSAAAVAAGAVPCALGSDTGGSVRLPAAFCGLFGLKPTYGSVSRHGLIAYASSLDVVGFLATAPADLRLLFDLVAGADDCDLTSVTADPLPVLPLRGLRVGWPREYQLKELDPAVQLEWTRTLERLQLLGAQISEISLPSTTAALHAYYILAPAEASSNLARYDGVKYGARAEGSSFQDAVIQSRSRFGSEVKKRIMVGNYVLGRSQYDSFYKLAQETRQMVLDEFAGAFDAQCDIIVCPAAPRPPPTLEAAGALSADEMYQFDVFTVPASLAGLPAVTIPAGSGVLFGMQLIGPKFSEQRLLAVSEALEHSERT